MRGLLTSVVLSLALAGLTASHDVGAGQPVRRRKTLGFGPHNPNSAFHTAPSSIPKFASSLRARGENSDSNDPLDLARDFVTEIMKDNEYDGVTFRIRDDSYTDKNTGVTHVYVRQVVFGVEVADGDININVKDGKVLSYGDSFWKGNVEQLFMNNPVPEVHADLCGHLNEHLATNLKPTGQMVMESSRPVDADFLRHLADSNCAHVGIPERLAALREEMSMFDVREPLLQFMAAATPNADVAQDILSRYDAHLEAIETSTENYVAGPLQFPIFHLSNVPDAVKPVKANMVYVQIPHGDGTRLEPVYRYEVEMQDNWYEATVSSRAPHRIISVVDWASDSPMPVPAAPSKEKKEKTHPPAIYNVFGWGVNDPSEGNRTTEKENFDTLASPVGWHAIPWSVDPTLTSLKTKPAKGEWHNATTTWGNNVFAHEDWEGRNDWIDNYRPDAGPTMEFNFTYDPKKTEKGDALEEAKKYINATVTQLFYTSNLVHDLYYRYGFDEVAGNFQQYNFGRGGREGDAVIANAQDGSGYNNANFMTPPDGQNGRCRMYLWNTASPYRDGDLEAGIVIHELSHGLSTRLTGGPANSGCLGWGESGGMGEGWGDFLATTIRSTSNYSDFPMGAWAANRPTGIRNYVYSLNETVNPSTYKTLDKPGYWGVHAIGEVWAEMLWVTSQGLIAKHGYSSSLFPPAPLDNGTVPEGDFYRPREFNAQGVAKPLVPKHGNTLMIQLVLNGMKLQQCRPDFFDARDAIIQADQILTGGENFCELWTGFAARGLGPDATVEMKTPWGGGVRTDDYKPPLACRTEKIPEDPKEPEPEEPED